MTSLLKRAWGYVRRFWWAILGGLLLIAAWIFSATRKKKPLTKSDLLSQKGDPRGVDSLRQLAAIEAEKAQTDILIEKAKADTKVEAKREQLDRIKEDQDPASRRRRLARFAEQNI